MQKVKYPYHLDSIQEQKFVELKGYSNYFISSFGYVMRKEHMVVTKERNNARGHLRVLSEIVLTRYIRTDGYWGVDIKGKGHLLHRLLASHFIPNPENKPCINHKDGNRWNLLLSNLEWCTYHENNQHAYDVLNKKGYFDGRIGDMHPNSRPLLQCDLNGVVIKRHESARQAAVNNGFKCDNILYRYIKRRKPYNKNLWIYDC